MTSRLQSNTVILQRKSEAPRSWLGKQRAAVGNGSLVSNSCSKSYGQMTDDTTAPEIASNACEYPRPPSHHRTQYPISSPPHSLALPCLHTSRSLRLGCHCSLHTAALSRTNRVFAVHCSLSPLLYPSLFVSFACGLALRIVAAVWGQCCEYVIEKAR
jgi:hypothetical protein